MIDNQAFFNGLKDIGVDFYTGVPDSLLKHFCAYVTDNVDSSHHVIAANEGNAVGIAAGYNLATGKTPLVYMQNSGLGNAVNPLTSLTHEEIYGIPMILLVGWRGGTYDDEPQHKVMGEITREMLEIMGIENRILHKNSDIERELKSAKLWVTNFSAPFCLLVDKDTFAPYEKKEVFNSQVNEWPTREEVLEEILNSIPEDSVVISTTGVCSREIWEIRERNNQSHKYDFLTVGSMGHASSIALGVSMFTEKKVFCIDGDGAALMHLGSLGINAVNAPDNFIHILINNFCHDSVGAQPTIGSSVLFAGIAKKLGYEDPHVINRLESIKESIKILLEKDEASFLEIRGVKPGFRKDLGRPKDTPFENKYKFINHLRDDQ